LIMFSTQSWQHWSIDKMDSEVARRCEGGRDET